MAALRKIGTAVSTRIDTGWARKQSRVHREQGVTVRMPRTATT